MQTVETLNEGLKRAYTMTITARDIDAKVDAEVKRVAPQVRMPGFRPGKVPANLVRKMHGEAIAADALNSAIQQGVQGLIQEQNLRPAMQPSVELAEGYEPGRDAEVKVALEVLPQVPAPAIDGLTLERLTAPVDDVAVDAQLRKFADQAKNWADAGDKAAEMGDLVTVDFVGKTADGVAFEGGTGTDMAVELGGGRLIPGFEDQLVGVKAGEERTLNVTFPGEYPAKELAGKDATFDITATSVKVAAPSEIDEALAKNLGLESLDQLRGLVRGQIEQEHNGLTRTYMKRKLLDQLAAGHDFEVPPSMVDAEFGQIWQQLEHEATHEADPDAARAEMEAERDDYRRIAERRVRLGLLLSEIGQANGVEITSQEMNRLIQQAVQQYGPEDRQRFVQYIQQEPMAAAQLRAPLYEDKVVDFLFGKAAVTDREATRAELEAAIESDDGFATGTHSHDHDDPKPRKSPRAKKAVADGEQEAKPAKAKPTKPVAKGANAAPQTEGTDADAAAPAPVKKPRVKKVAAESGDLTGETSASASATKPEAGMNAEADAAPAPKKARKSGTEKGA